MKRVLMAIMIFIAIAAIFLFSAEGSHFLTMPNDTYVNGTFAALNPQTSNIIDTNYGLTNSSNKIRVNIGSATGLQFSAGSLGIKAADPTIGLSSSGAKLGASKVHVSTISGGAAGNHTLTGSALGDEVCGVTYWAKPTYNLSSMSDLTTEFQGTGKGIIASNVIANGGGTNTAGGFLQIFWIDRT